MHERCSNTPRAWFPSYPGVRIKYRHNKRPLLPCPTIILTSPVHSSSLHHLTGLVFPSSNHFLPSALFWYNTILFCSRFDSLAGPPQPLVISLTSILRHPLRFQTEVKRSTGWMPHAWFSDTLSAFPDSLQLLWSPEIRAGSTGIISQPRGWPVKCLLITLLCALSHTLSSDHTNRPPSLERQSFPVQHALILSPEETHRSVNNSQQYRHSGRAVQTDARSGWMERQRHMHTFWQIKLLFG